MVKAGLNSMMERSTTDNGFWAKRMAKVFFRMSQVKSMMEIGCLEKLMDMVNLNIKVAQFTKVNGLRINSMEMDLKFGQMAVAMKATITKELRMDSALIDGQMVLSMLETG